MKKRRWYWISGLAVLVLIGMIAGIATNYFRSIAENIESDSRRHLKEVYEQVNHSFLAFVDKNWGFLDSCNDYLDLAEGTSADRDATVRTFVHGKKDFWGFSDFYFLDTDRNYVTADGAAGQFPLSSSLTHMIENKEPIMAGETIEDQRFTLFAVAAEPGTFSGFAYQAIAISYTNTDMALALNANAFEGNAKCFVLNREGNVLLSTWEGGASFGNYFTYFKRALAAAGLSEAAQAEIDARIRSEFDQMLQHPEDTENSGYLQTPLEVDGQTHCIVYMPVGYEDYFLLSVVPQNAVSAGFLSAQRATLGVMIAIFLLVIVTIIALLVAQLVMQSRKSRTELRYRERMFDVLSNTVDDIFIMLDTGSHKVDYLSPNVERLLGIRNETVRKDIRALAKCAADADIVVPKEVLAEIPRGGNRSWECKYMHQATKEQRWYRVTIYSMSIRDVKKYIVVMSDRTLERQMNRQLSEALDAAKSANEAKSNFLSNMSHDIRTPMNAILGFSLLLEKNAEDKERVYEYTHKIIASGHHLLSLINDVLDMSKIESGKTSLNVGKFSLPDLLEELSLILVPQAKAKNQEFRIHTHGKPPELLMGDKLRLNQILINLLSNAIKYTPQGGQIDFTICELPDSPPQYAKLRFLVKDNGIGMSEAFQQEIFQPFSREKNAATSEIQGTGLGMAITKNLVDLMGGIINLESAPGAGSTFTVELTFALADAEEAGDLWYKQKITRVLVADDEEEICLGIVDLLHGAGVDVHYVTDGAAAVEAACEAHENGTDFSVILLDWKMPGMNGVEVARKIRDRIRKQIPILVLTSYDWSDVETEAREAGINAFMPKPFFVSTFWQTLKPLFVEAEPIEPDPAAKSALCGKRFLVAEDNELNAEILTKMLAMDGAQCDVAQNGKIALERFEQSAPGQYDMILMDVQMPILNGYEATKAIRACPHPDAQRIPIVAMTANTFAEDVRDALAAGMNGHLAKPLNPEALYKMVAELVPSEPNSEHSV